MDKMRIWAMWGTTYESEEQELVLQSISSNSPAILPIQHWLIISICTGRFHLSPTLMNPFLYPFGFVESLNASELDFVFWTFC